MLKVNYWEAETVLDEYFSTSGPRRRSRACATWSRKRRTLVKPSFAEYFDYAPGTDPEYQARLSGRKALREAVVALLDEFQLDAVVFPYKTLAGELLDGGDEQRSGPDQRRGALRRSRLGLRQLLELDDGPAGAARADGLHRDGAPLALEFLGRPFSEPTLLKLASGYEARTHHRHAPAATPPLPGESFSY